MSDTEKPEADADAEPELANDPTDIPKFRLMGMQGEEYREEMEFAYYAMEGVLLLKPLADPQFLPIAAALQQKMGIDAEEAQEMMEDEKDETGSIDASQFDEDFVTIMHEAATMGIARDGGIAEGMDEEGVREVVQGLQGGKSLEIAERVLDISSDPEGAESFRGERSGE